MWPAALLGLAWAHVAIALRVLVLPGYLALGNGISETWWYRLADWTLLAPFELASALTGLVVWGGVSRSQFATLMLCPLLGVGLGLAVWSVLGLQRWRRSALSCLACVGLLGGACAMGVALQLRDVVLAERTFFAMVARVSDAHADSATVSAAGEFARRHPDSRWTGEALRIVAMAEWDAGRIESASRLWDRFASRFRDRSAPGVAYAEYSMALCDERLGREADAEHHLREAIETIRTRGDGIQGWIAVEAARRLASHERSLGRHTLARYWKTESQAFANAYSIE